MSKEVAATHSTNESAHNEEIPVFTMQAIFQRFERLDTMFGEMNDNMEKQKTDIMHRMDRQERVLANVQRGQPNHRIVNAYKFLADAQKEFILS